ncbi:MAG: M23 family metallopeptidase, partial [Candidatus Dormibacteraeota bacterium]|nr:M23 family metallopeptidase [Candidatus Dormibacteraeota bacterium]
MTRTIAVITVAVAVLLSATTAAATFVLQTPVAAGAFLKPVLGATISQGFGCTSVSIEPADSACPGGHWHSGIDLAAGAGTPVVATAAGVAHVIVSATGFGLHVVIDHGGGLQSLYGHLSSVDVVDGQPVAGGQLIGAVGSTGNSTG